jgi:hypothetical protein
MPTTVTIKTLREMRRIKILDCAPNDLAFSCERT